MLQRNLDKKTIVIKMNESDSHKPQKYLTKGRGFPRLYENVRASTLKITGYCALERKVLIFLGSFNPIPWNLNKMEEKRETCQMYRKFLELGFLFFIAINTLMVMLNFLENYNL